jgi:hypothetical protein
MAQLRMDVPSAALMKRVSIRPGSALTPREGAGGYDMPAFSRMSAEAERRPGARASAANPAMHALILLQQADGTWQLTKELASIIGRDLDELRSVVKGAGAEPDVQRAWATALALAWLSKNARSVQDEWRLLAAKAQRWIDRTTLVPPHAATWVEEAAGLVGH